MEITMVLVGIYAITAMICTICYYVVEYIRRGIGMGKAPSPWEALYFGSIMPIMWPARKIINWFR